MSSGLPIPKKTPAAPPRPDPRAHFAKETIARFESQVEQYPEKRAALIPILHYAQEEKGWLSRETLECVAAFLGLPLIQVWETASFYPMFHLERVGRHVAWICRNISCDLRGATELVEAARAQCGIRPGETTPDGKVTLRLAECLGGCAAAPVAEIDGKYHENLTPERLALLLQSLV